MSQWLDILITAIAGSAAGTLIKALLRPERHLGRWLQQAAASLLTGGVVGAAAIEYFRLQSFAGSLVAAAGAILAEELVRGLQARGRRIQEGRFDLSLRGDDPDER